MLNARQQFEENLKRARSLGALAAAIGALTAPVIDVSDILRAQLVLAVSALDHFIHELSRLGMIQIAKGERQKTDAYLRFQTPIQTVEAALSGLAHENWLGEAIREKHSYLSFQDPEKIADAIRLISAIKLWDEVANKLTIPAADIKTRLKLIVARRNKIAHEADMDPSNPGFRWPISEALVADATNFVERVGISIHEVVG